MDSEEILLDMITNVRDTVEKVDEKLDKMVEREAAVPLPAAEPAARPSHLKALEAWQAGQRPEA